MDDIEDCAKTQVELCSDVLETVRSKQEEYKKEKGRHLTVERAIKLIIREWDKLSKEIK